MSRTAPTHTNQWIFATWLQTPKAVYPPKPGCLKSRHSQASLQTLENELSQPVLRVHSYLSTILVILGLYALQSCLAQLTCGPIPMCIGFLFVHSHLSSPQLGPLFSGVCPHTTLALYLNRHLSDLHKDPISNGYNSQ